MVEIESLLSEQNVLFELDINNKKDLFNTIANHLLEKKIIKDSKVLLKDLNKRESQMSTGMVDGFAIPHAMSKTVIKPTVLFMKTGLIDDYQTLDESVVNCVFAILVPKDSSDKHLEILSNLSRKLMVDEFRNSLKNVKNSSEFMNIIKEIEL